MSIHMKKGKKRTEGFTLVELICVIAILGILAVSYTHLWKEQSTGPVSVKPCRWKRK